MIKLIITDDHKIVRDGIRSLLQEEEDVEVIAEASNGQQLMELLTDQPADVVLMDINMPVMDGIEASQQVKDHFPDTKVLALSMLDHENYVRQIIQAGALGFVMKSCSKEELLFAIKAVATGNKFICSEMACKLLDTTSVKEKVPPLENSGQTASIIESLSKCEKNVLNLIAEGYTNAEIADKLFNSKRTIESHRQNLLLKTQCKNTANLVKFALTNNLLNQ